MNKPPSRRKKTTPAASNDSTLPNDLAEEDISPQENPALATIDVTAVEIPELTEQEQSDRLHLERRVERAFFEAGKALTELRDRRLYRSTHKTFEDYCRERFGFSRRQPYHLIEAAVIFDNLVEKCERMQEMCDRITRLRENENLEEAGRAVLKYLGELKRPYLTGVEEKLLILLESQYGVRIIL
ncbi:MAG TPA: hypothetical protein VE944_21565 [Nostoc sp.]|uniref:hypothetical protein n=1 Tax=Nostoc sp. TaxID=1180 RepID=UPI002D3CAD8A|nr:hypothetical protein [Nostoc sp.]HYX16889.1 hypothetical protein [Nostoc sp.]